MSPEDEQLAQECHAFSLLLSGRTPGAYVVSKYVAAHGEPGRFEPVDAVDAGLVRIAARMRVLRRPAAAYARVFRPKGALQRKLVMLLAVLESSPPSYRVFDSAVRGGPVGTTLVLAARTAWWAGSLLVGVVVLGPWAALRAGEGGPPA